MSSVCGQADIDGLGTDFYIRQGIGNTLSRLKGLKTVPNDLGIMDKNIQTIIAGYETEPFLFIEPGHFTFKPHGIPPKLSHEGDIENTLRRSYWQWADGYPSSDSRSSSSA